MGKPVTALIIASLFGYGPGVGLRVAVALAQIGEFSLILATVGNQLNILPANATNLIVATAILTITLNPIPYRSIGRLDASLARWERTRRHAEPEQAGLTKDDEKSGYRAVVLRPDRSDRISPFERGRHHTCSHRNEHRDHPLRSR